jgi:hypothetical protein
MHQLLQYVAVMRRTLGGATEEVVSKASTFGRDLQRLADKGLFTLNAGDALGRNADGCAKGGAANGGSIHKPPAKADAAFRPNPAGKRMAGALRRCRFADWYLTNGARGASHCIPPFAFALSASARTGPDSTPPMAAAVDRRRATPTQLRRFAYDFSARPP